MNKRNVVKTVAAHGAAVGAMNMITTVFLHRGETHGAIEVKRPVREVARFGTWLLSGMKPREWVGVHLAHHADEDGPSDPHSPAQNGRFGVLKVGIGNGLYYYRQKAKTLTPADYPEHLQPDWKDKLLYDRGLVGQAAMFGLYRWLHKGDNKKAAASLLVHDGLMLAGGAFVNSWLHRGQNDGVCALVEEPVPDANGDFTRNSNILGDLATFGEGEHYNHHDDQSSLRFHESNVRDLGGFVAEELIRVGLADPGTGPRPRGQEIPTGS